MRAIDTNVAARFLLDDDPVQAAIARDVFAEPVFIPVTVLLELSWLLTSRYRQPCGVVAAALAELLDLPMVAVADPDRIGWALARLAEGGDPADLLHVAVSGDAGTFATFDRDIAESAGPNPPLPIETLG